jgi:anionic cell wall polymer biosynthesis LytR-Cps2A-Psr (LCP) family protein
VDEPTDSDTPPPRARRSDRRRRGGRGGTVVTEPVGRRSRARRRRRRRALTRTGLIVTLLALTAVAVLLVASGLVDRARDVVAQDDEPDHTELPGDRQPTLALITYEEGSEDAGARSIAILAYDRETDQGTVLLVPPSTVADVPGHGSFGVGQAFAFGDAPLTGVTLENLLGIRLDEVVALSSQGWMSLLAPAEGYEIDVSSQLVDGDGQVRFEPGAQYLDTERLAEYLSLRQEGETELDHLPRVQRVLSGLLDRLGEEPDLLDAMFSDGAPLPGATDQELVRNLLGELADARARDRVVTLTLPVSPLGSGREDAYRVDGSRLAQLIEERLAASRPTGEAGAGRSLQILNGNGVPGIGQVVAERLQPGGYRVLLTGNADRFTYETTRIIVHDDGEEQLAIARDIRDRLGVGEIERSGTPQSVVDVTIVVGADLIDGDLPEDVPPSREVGEDDEEGPDDGDDADDEDTDGDDDA